MSPRDHRLLFSPSFDVVVFLSEIPLKNWYSYVNLYKQFACDTFDTAECQ